MKRTLTLLTFAALLLAPLAAPHAADAIAPLDPISWKPSAASIPAERRPATFEVRGEEGLRFSLAGELATTKQMRWERPWTAGELATNQFIVLEYRARWLQGTALAAVSQDASAKAVVTSLVSTPDLIVDGHWHRLIVHSPYPARPTALRVTLQSRDSQAWFEVRRLEWVPSVDQAGSALVEDSQPTPQPDLVPLKLQFNDRFDWLMNRSLTQRPRTRWCMTAGLGFRTTTSASAASLFTWCRNRS